MELDIRESRQKGWFFIDNIFVDSFAKKLKTSGIVVYMSLCRHADNKTQECYPTIEGIAKQHAISKSTVIRAIKRLEEFNLIHVEREIIERENGVQKKNRYTLLDKNVWQGVTDDTLTKIPKQGVKRDQSRVSPEYYKETHINKTHIVAKATEATLEKEFNRQEAIQSLIDSENLDLKVIGMYLKIYKVPMENREILSGLIARCRKDFKNSIKSLGQHPLMGFNSSQIQRAFMKGASSEIQYSFIRVLEKINDLSK